MPIYDYECECGFFAEIIVQKHDTKLNCPDCGKELVKQISKPAKPQLPADVGLFGDEHLQLDLVEMLQDDES